MDHFDADEHFKAASDEHVVRMARAGFKTAIKEAKRRGLWRSLQK